MPATLTNKLKIFNAKNFIESYKETGEDNLYVFLGAYLNEWAVPSAPPIPIDSQKYKYDTFKNIQTMRKVDALDMVHVVKRVEWTSGDVYAMIDDEIGMIGGIDPVTSQSYNYYVMTNTFKVYVCLDNNNGAVSINEPTETGSASFITADGYKWKYLYTVGGVDVVNFLNVDWIPVRETTNTPIIGSVETIVIENGGTGYDDLNPPAVVFTVDTEIITAEATANINTVDGSLESISVTNIGQGYSNLQITIDNTGVTGDGGTVRGILSEKGVGYNAVDELGANGVMIVSSFDGDEGGLVPIGIDYRQSGLILNPFTTITGTVLSLSTVNGTFEVGDQILGSASAASGQVVHFNIEKSILYINLDFGSSNFNSSDNLTTSVGGSGATATVSSANNAGNLPATSEFIDTIDDLDYGNGDIIYINNRVTIGRFAEQEEKVKLVITF